MHAQAGGAFGGSTIKGSSDLWGRLKVKSLQAVEIRPSAALSGRFTVSATCQEVAPYSSRRHPHLSSCQAQGRLIAAYVVGNGLKPFPTKDFGRPPQAGFRSAQLPSACLRVVPLCGTEAGAFFSIHKNILFQQPIRQTRRRAWVRGRRPVHGRVWRFEEDPREHDHILLYEYPPLQ